MGTAWSIIFGISLTVNVLLVTVFLLFAKRGLRAIEKIMQFEEDVNEFQAFIEKALDKMSMVDSHETRIIRQGLMIMMSRLQRYSGEAQLEQKQEVNPQAPVGVD